MREALTARLKVMLPDVAASSLNGAPLVEHANLVSPFVGGFRCGTRAHGWSCASPLSSRVCAHHLVTKIQSLALDPRLLGRNRQPHEPRCPRALAVRFAELGDRIQPDRMLGFLSTRPKTTPETTKDWRSQAAPPDRGVGGIARCGVVDVVGIALPPRSCWVRETLPCGAAPAWFASVVGNSLPTSDSDRVWPRRVSEQQVE